MKTLTASEQRQALLKYVGKHGRFTTLNARSIGVMHPASRVQELRKQGYNFVTNRIDETDGAGVLHKRVAVYTLDGGKHE
jgi:hypothetical protein